MRRIITYGTYDLLHYGHIKLLQRAKALGDYLIVGLSTDEFNWNEKHKKCYFTYEERKEMLEALRCVDLVIPEENWEQKKEDMHLYHIDTFVIGDDWKGKFDFLKDEGHELDHLSRKIKSIEWIDNHEQLLFHQEGSHASFRAVGYPYGCFYIVRIAKITFE